MQTVRLLIAALAVFNGAAVLFFVTVGIRRTLRERQRPPIPTFHHDRRENRDRNRTHPEQ